MGKTTDGYCPKDCPTRANGRNTDEREIPPKNVTDVTENDGFKEGEEPTQIFLRQNT